MPELLKLPQFQVYAICVAILTLNLLAIGFYTALKRTGSKAVLNPEDVMINPGSQAREAEDPAVLRAQRAHRNALESIVPFLALGLVYVLSGIATPTGAWLYFGIFTGARLLHTVVYLAGKQPWRTIFFGVGALCLVGLCVQILIHVVPSMGH